METDFVSSRTRKAVVPIAQGSSLHISAKVGSAAHYSGSSYRDSVIRITIITLKLNFLLDCFTLCFSWSETNWKVYFYCITPIQCITNMPWEALQCSNTSLSVRICKVMNKWKSITKERRYGKSDCPLRGKSLIASYLGKKRGS